MVRRGEVYWLQLFGGSSLEQAGRRPVLVIQNDIGNRSRPTTIIAVITSQPSRRRYPFHIPTAIHESGLQLDGTVLCEQV